MHAQIAHPLPALHRSPLPAPPLRRAQAQLEPEAGGLGGKSYVLTCGEGDFPSRRLRQMAASFQVTQQKEHLVAAPVAVADGGQLPGNAAMRHRCLACLTAVPFFGFAPLIFPPFARRVPFCALFDGLSFFWFACSLILPPFARRVPSCALLGGHTISGLLPPSLPLSPGTLCAPLSRLDRCVSNKRCACGNKLQRRHGVRPEKLMEGVCIQNAKTLDDQMMIIVSLGVLARSHRMYIYSPRVLRLRSSTPTSSVHQTHELILCTAWVC